MRGTKKYTVAWILTYILPLIALLTYFYVSSNKNIAFIVEAPRIEFKDLKKGYNFATDEQDIIQIEEDKITFTYNEIKINDFVIRNGDLTIPLDGELILNGVYYKYDIENNNLKRIVFSEELKAAAKENRIVIGISVIVIAAALSVGILLIIKKMDILKEYRRLSVVVSMFSLFIIFLVLSVITKYIFLVFGVLSLSTGLHYIEWIIYRKKNGLPIKEEIKQKVVIVDE